MSADQLADQVLQEISSLNHSEEPEVLYDMIYEQEEKIDDLSILSNNQKEIDPNVYLREMMATLRRVENRMTKVSAKVDKLENQQTLDKEELKNSIKQNTVSENTLLLASEWKASENRDSNHLDNRNKKSKEVSKSKLNDKKQSKNLNPDSDDSLASDLDY